MIAGKQVPIFRVKEVLSEEAAFKLESKGEENENKKPAFGTLGKSRLSFGNNWYKDLQVRMCLGHKQAKGRRGGEIRGLQGPDHVALCLQIQKDWHSFQTELEANGNLHRSSDNITYWMGYGDRIVGKQSKYN